MEHVGTKFRRKIMGMKAINIDVVIRLSIKVRMEVTKFRKALERVKKGAEDWTPTEAQIDAYLSNPNTKVRKAALSAVEAINFLKTAATSDVLYEWPYEDELE
jgi:hypothetical protein